MLLQCSLILLLTFSAGVSAQRRPYPIPSPSGGQQQQQGGAEILEQLSEISPDGSFHTKYATANGISYEETGQPKNLGNEVAEEVQGSASWTADDGQQFSLSWHADENGAVLQGDHLPTSPPIPPLIQRALDFIAANPPRDAAQGAYVDDGDQIGSLKPNFQGSRRTGR